jgi:preprotein translocase subunit SecY
VTELFERVDPTLVLLVATVAGMAAAAWLLQMACAVAAVEAPDYWQSLLCVFLVVVSNVMLRFWVNTTVADPGLGSQLVWPLVMTAGIVAVMVRTGPLSAMVVTACEGIFCAGLYLGVSMANSALQGML